jgi:hypothetical protein
LQPKNPPSWPQVCLARIPSVNRALGYMKQSWPQVCLARTPSIKRALGYIKQSWPQVFFWARTPFVKRALGYIKATLKTIEVKYMCVCFPVFQG